MENYIKGNVKLLGLIGYPISHTFSPLLINSICEILNMNYLYVPLQVKNGGLEKAIEAFKILEIKGINVTMPYKTPIMDYISNYSSEAQIIGAVNTIKFEEEVLTGYNTDYSGFKRSLEYNNINMKNKKTLILGAGGAARAVALACLDSGSNNIIILNRNGKRAKDVCSMLNGIQKNASVCDEINKENIDKYINESDIIVNTTSIGMSYSDQKLLDFNLDLLNKEKTVCDIIYNPCDTELIKLAKNKGCNVMNGVGMFVFQGIKAFEIWTGKNLPLEYIDGLIKKVEKASKNY